MQLPPHIARRDFTSVSGATIKAGRLSIENYVRERSTISIVENGGCRANVRDVEVPGDLKSTHQGFLDSFHTFVREQEWATGLNYSLTINIFSRDILIGKEKVSHTREISHHVGVYDQSDHVKTIVVGSSDEVVDQLSSFVCEFTINQQLPQFDMFMGKAICSDQNLFFTSETASIVFHEIFGHGFELGCINTTLDSVCEVIAYPPGKTDDLGRDVASEYLIKAGRICYFPGYFCAAAHSEESLQRLCSLKVTLPHERQDLPSCYVKCCSVLKAEFISNAAYILVKDAILVRDNIHVAKLPAFVAVLHIGQLSKLQAVGEGMGSHWGICTKSGNSMLTKNWCPSVVLRGATICQIKDNS